MKKLFVVLGIVACSFLTVVNSAQASGVFLNFDPATFTPDAANGDHNHVIATAFGNVTFNGRIWDKLNGVTVPDHTTGNDYFLKNTDAQDALTITFDFDVDSLSFWARTSGANVVVNGQAFDGAGLLIESGVVDSSNTAWVLNDDIDNPSAIRKIVLSSAGNGGNNFAIDDLTLDLGETRAAVPEPASLMLMGSGLAGLLRFRKKQV